MKKYKIIKPKNSLLVKHSKAEEIPNSIRFKVETDFIFLIISQITIKLNKW